MIDEYHLHIKVFINRSEIQEGKEGNDNSMEKAAFFSVLLSKWKYSSGKFICDSLYTLNDILAPK